MTDVTVYPTAAQRIRRPHWSLARTWLLQPGTPGGGEAFDAAIAGNADVVVLDIEDGLPDAQKPAGRVSVAEWLITGAQAWVRINSVATPAWSADLDALADAPGLLGVMLAKTESADDIAATAARLPSGTPVVALVESALGIESVTEIARTPRLFANCVRGRRFSSRHRHERGSDGAGLPACPAGDRQPRSGTPRADRRTDTA